MLPCTRCPHVVILRFIRRCAGQPTPSPACGASGPLEAHCGWTWTWGPGFLSKAEAAGRKYFNVTSPSSPPAVVVWGLRMALIETCDFYFELQTHGMVIC